MIKLKKAVNEIYDEMGKKSSYVILPMEQIIANPHQPRKYFSADALNELAASIKTYGLLQPITVRPLHRDRYEIVAGERRFRASKLAGFTHIKAIILDDAGHEDSAMLAMIENIQRENLHFFEEAQGIQCLLREHNFTQEELANRLGKNQSTIANKLRILKLSRQVKSEIISNGLTERHARALLRLHDEKLQLELIGRIRKNYLSVKQTEELVESEIQKIYGDTPKKPERMVKLMRSYQIYVNTVKKAVDAITASGIQADFDVKELPDKLTLTIEIHK